MLSAKTPAALADQASRLLEHLTTTPDADPVHIGWSLASTRTTFDHRAALTPTTNDYIPAPDRPGHQRPHPHLHHAHTTHPPKTAFVIPGQGSQRPGMGQQLYETSPTFRQKINDCADAFHPHTDWSLIDVLTNKPNAPSLKRVDITQPALFAMSVAPGSTMASPRNPPPPPSSDTPKAKSPPPTSQADSPSTTQHASSPSDATWPRHLRDGAACSWSRYPPELGATTPGVGWPGVDRRSERSRFGRA